MSGDGEKLWKSGLTHSAHLRRMADLYPSLSDRFEAILERSSPKIRQLVGLMLSRARSAQRALPTPQSLIERYGLTNAEARLAVALAEGVSLGQYARERGASPQTARNQLQTIFQKTGVNRQAELVSLLLDGHAPPTAGA